MQLESLDKIEKVFEGNIVTQEYFQDYKSYVYQQLIILEIKQKNLESYVNILTAALISLVVASFITFIF